MRSIERSVLVPHAADRMFQLIDEVETYPEFLPWCAGVDLIERTGEFTTARLHLRYAGIDFSFATRNLKTGHERMDIRLLDGPFSSLQGRWIFQPLGDSGCRVSLGLDFEFESAVLERTAGAVFERVAATLVDSFVARADASHRGFKV